MPTLLLVVLCLSMSSLALALVALLIRDLSGLDALTVPRWVFWVYRQVGIRTRYRRSRA
jgi:hypothetical protein